MSTRYIGATIRLIGVLKRAHIVLGVISAKRSMIMVTTPVAINIPYSSGNARDLARDILAIVHSAEAATLTRLFPIITVISSLSISDFTISRDFAHHRFSFISHFTLWREVLRKAISVPEKNADKAINIIKRRICWGSK